MVAGSHLTIAHERDSLSYEDACEIAVRAVAAGRCERTRVELRHVTETSTAALARLILLRRKLLQSGHDLRIVGLRGRAKALYEVSRMGRLLPREIHPADSGISSEQIS